MRTQAKLRLVPVGKRESWKKKRERKLGLEEGNKLSLSLRGHCGRVEGAACWVNVS